MIYKKKTNDDKHRREVQASSSAFFMTPPNPPAPSLSPVSISLCCRFLTLSAFLNHSVSFVQHFGLRQRNGSSTPCSTERWWVEIRTPWFLKWTLEVSLIPHYTASFSQVPIQPFWSILCSPWHPDSTIQLPLKHIFLVIPQSSEQYNCTAVSDVIMNL